MTLKDNVNRLVDELREERDALKIKLQVLRLDALEGWDKVEDVLAELKEEKDVARVKMHLAKLEALEGLDRISEKFQANKPTTDDLRVRMHLAKLEALEEWDELEDKLSDLNLKAKAQQVGEESANLAKKAAEEIKAGFAKLWEKL